MSTNWVPANLSSDGKGTFAFGAFSATATTKVLAVHVLPTAPPGHVWEVEDVILERITDFSGGAVSACSVEIGKSGSTAKFLAASTDVFTGAKATAARTMGSNTTSVKPSNFESMRQQIDCKMTATGANTDALTAGRLAIYLKVGLIPGSGA